MAENLTIPIYPFDPTGKKASNLITNEQQIITSNNWRDFHFIVPRLAPFFGDSVKLLFTAIDGSKRYLIEGVDWYPSHMFVDASKACANDVYGSISFLNTFLAGTITIEKYQTIGGTWVLDDKQIAEILGDRLRNPRITAWEQVVDLPNRFPVVDHEWDLVDMVGAKDVYKVLMDIHDTLRLTGQEGLVTHLQDFNNPHKVTPTIIGLGSVRNYPIATTAEAIAGIINTAYMTPALVKEHVDKTWGVVITNHMNDQSNSHRVTAHQTGTYTGQEIDQFLTGKLDLKATAYNTDRFDSMSSTQYAAWVLAGTAANASKAYGMTLSELKLNIQGGASADAERFAGRTWDQATAEILSGTAAKATRFGNMTATEYADYILASKIADSAKLNGQTTAQLTASILSGTAANASAFGGKDPITYANDVLTGTAANASRLANMTVAELTAAILAGTAANATKFNGKTEEQFIQSVMIGKAADSAKLNGQDTAQLTTSILSGTAANATRFDNKTAAEYKADVLTGTAANASRFAGKTLDEVMLYVSQNSSGNASTLDGRTTVQLKAHILDGTAANAVQFDGYSKETYRDYLSRSFASIGVSPATTGVAQAKTYVKLFAGLKFPSVPTTENMVSQYLVTGGDPVGAATVPTWILSLDQRAATPVLVARNIGEDGSNNRFGYTIEVIDGVTFYNVYMEVAGNHTQITTQTITAINSRENSVSYLEQNAVPETTAPAGIVYGTIKSQADGAAVVALTSRVSTLESALTAVTDRVAALETSVSTITSETTTGFNNIGDALDSVAAAIQN